MRFSYIVLDGYCEYDRGFKYNNKPCKEHKGELGSHCIGCDCFSYSETDDVLVYANEKGQVETVRDSQAMPSELDTFEEDTERYEELQELWKSVCRKKIDEAYDEFIELKHKKKVQE